MAEVTPKIIGLRETNIDDGKELYEFFLIPGENVEISFKSVRDKLIVTNKRFITIDIQGFTGKKKEYMTIPFSKIQAFSCESAGTFDLDSELKIWVSGLGKVEYTFVKSDVKPLVQILSRNIL